MSLKSKLLFIFEYVCVCVVYIPLEFHALIDEVSKNGMRSVLYLTKIYCETHSTSQSPPLKHPIC